MKRSVVVARPARLSLTHGLLTIENEDGVHTVPLEDLAIVVIDHEAIVFTGPLLGRLGEAGVAVIFCGGKHLPTGILMPYEGHSLMPQILRAQIAASKPSKKQIWQSIIRAKIESQARFLVEETGRDHGLWAYAQNVRSGDTTNREAAAASTYFEALFGEGFIRIRQQETVGNADRHFLVANACLNYGYAVLRATMARAVVLSGLHPALGIYHRHRENTFSLADDLFEPVRVLVDRLVVDTMNSIEGEFPTELNPQLKRSMLRVLTVEVGWNGGSWPLDAALEAYVAGVRDCLTGEKKVLEIPIA